MTRKQLCSRRLRYHHHGRLSLSRTPYNSAARRRRASPPGPCRKRMVIRPQGPQTTEEQSRTGGANRGSGEPPRGPPFLTGFQMWSRSARARKRAGKSKSKWKPIYSRSSFRPKGGTIPEPQAQGTSGEGRKTRRPDLPGHRRAERLQYPLRRSHLRAGGRPLFLPAGRKRHLRVFPGTSALPADNGGEGEAFTLRKRYVFKPGEYLFELHVEIENSVNEFPNLGRQTTPPTL